MHEEQKINPKHREIRQVLRIAGPLAAGLGLLLIARPAIAQQVQGERTDLRVTARTSSFSFRGQGVAIPEIAKRLNVAYVLLGHTHVQGMQVCNDVTVVNPGSVGQPRDGDPRAAFLLFDTDAGTVTLRRCEYDIEAEARDIIDAGLPAILADRLYLGA